MTKKLGKNRSRFDKYFKINGTYSPRQRVPLTRQIPPGVFNTLQDDQGNIYFQPIDMLSDELLDLPDTVSDKVFKEACKFWEGKTRSRFEEYGLVYKRGFLLYGKQGTGKSCTIVRLAEKMVSNGGVVLFCPPIDILGNAIKQLRQVEPDLEIMVIFEDFEPIATKSSFLSLLDGEIQADNIVYVATTNHIEQVPDKIKNRPSRFATVIEVDAPCSKARQIYLKHKLKGASEKELSEWVRHSEGMVIDQIKDLIVTVRCFDIPLKDAVAKIAGMETMSDLKKETEVKKYQNTIMESIASSVRSLYKPIPITFGGPEEPQSSN